MVVGADDGIRHTSRWASPRAPGGPRGSPTALRTHLATRRSVQRHHVVSGDLDEHRFELVDDVQISLHLFVWHMDGWIRPNSGHVTGSSRSSHSTSSCTNRGGSSCDQCAIPCRTTGGYSATSRARCDGCETRDASGFVRAPQCRWQAEHDRLVELAPPMRLTPMRPYGFDRRPSGQSRSSAMHTVVASTMRKLSPRSPHHRPRRLRVGDAHPHMSVEVHESSAPRHRRSWQARCASDRREPMHPLRNPA